MERSHLWNRPFDAHRLMDSSSLAEAGLPRMAGLGVFVFGIRWTVGLAMTGLAMIWIGGYVKSSQATVCLDALEPGGSCFGTFASDAWQVIGLGSLVVGTAFVLGALFLELRRRRGA
ncbi:hypothetical protein [Nocardioides sp.]